MGVAAYNRGSKIVAERVQQAYPLRPHEFEIMQRLNGLTKHPGAPAPFGDILFTKGSKAWWAQCPRTGFGYPYATLDDAVRNWDVTVYSVDTRGWLARPNAVGTTGTNKHTQTS